MKQYSLWIAVNMTAWINTSHADLTDARCDIYTTMPKTHF